MLVGGCPRSGTTLLRTMLNSHPQLAVPHETRFVVPAWRRREQFGDLTRPENRRAAARWILDLPKSRFAKRIGIPREELIEAFAEAPPSLGSLLETCFSLYAKRDGKERWGDKRPSYARNLDVVFGLFPDAQYVNVVRDPRACVASMRRSWQGWGRPASAIEIWEGTDRAVRTALRKRPPQQITEIRYEDLVTDPEAVLGRLCDFLALDPAGIPDMLNHHQGSDLPTGALHAAAAKPVTADYLRRWTSELDSSEIAFIEHALASGLQHHGYEPSNVSTPVSQADLAEFKRIRSRRKREELRRRLLELKRTVTYRQPTAALPKLPKP